MSQQLRILIIDDDSSSARAIAKLLKIHGYTGDVCTASKDCLATIENTRPDVVLLDVNMPGMTGFDIAEELRINPDLRPRKLIAITGQSDIGAQLSAAGFDSHLVKPIEWEHLKRLLESA